MDISPQHRLRHQERLEALIMLREVLETLVPSIPNIESHEGMLDFLLTPDTVSVMQEAIAIGRGMRQRRIAPQDDGY